MIQKFIAFVISLIFLLPNFAHSNENNIRLISLSPHLTEMVFSAGAAHLLVGVVNFSDYPKQATKLPIVGDFNKVSIEQIIKLQPSLILSWKSGNSLQDINKLKKLGFNVWQTEITELADIPLQIQAIGKKTKQEDTANKVATNLKQILKEVRQQYIKNTKITTFYQVWNNPLYTVGKNQFISQAIELCGGINIFSNIDILAPQVSIEAIIEKNPELIILGGSTKLQKNWLYKWQRYPIINAVKNNNIIKVDSSILQRPTARFINYLPFLCKNMHKKRE